MRLRPKRCQTRAEKKAKTGGDLGDGLPFLFGVRPLRGKNVVEALVLHGCGCDGEVHEADSRTDFGRELEIRIAGHENERKRWREVNLESCRVE